MEEVADERVHTKKKQGLNGGGHRRARRSVLN